MNHITIHTLTALIGLALLSACGGGAACDTEMTPTATQPLKKTGQTKSYENNTTEVSDGSLKDDGHYQKGTTANYTRDNAKEVVTDHVTGLMWQDDADAKNVTKQWLTDANYATCKDDNASAACSDTSGDTIATYCAALNLGGYTDWRVPTADELAGILDYGRSDPSIDPTFHNTSASYYWSATDHTSHTDAWYVGFSDGKIDYSNLFSDKSSKRNIRCVRGEEHNTSGNFVTNGDVILDNTTGLRWQDNEDAEFKELNWKGAIEYCESLSICGKNDWRLPNIHELQSIVDRTHDHPTIAPEFTHVNSALLSQYYWSSTGLTSDENRAWSIGFGGGVSGSSSKIKMGGSDSEHLVRCVQGGE